MIFEGQKIAESSFASRVASAMADAEPGSQKIERVSSLEALIRKIFREEVVKKPRLTWTAGENPHGEKVSAGWRGKFNRFLAFVGPIGGHYIQNRMVLRGNGEETTIDDPKISHEPHRWQDKYGKRWEAPSDYDTLKRAYEDHLKAAITADPMLCEVCLKYVAKDADERMRHLYTAHPAEFAEKVGLKVQTAAEYTESATEVAAAPDRPPALRCNFCDKLFKDNRGLSAHKRFSHKPE